ncbi:MAG: tRNA 2-selenouridine(34) synthase MnmH [Caulobacteraceae bacterium]
MIASLDDLGPARLAGFDVVIDVRTPTEFALDRLPGAINLPVLTDEERARVGTIYVQESRFLARRIGAALIARNIADHLDVALADKPGSFSPLIYCWRGGQRSGAMATILDQIGWRVAVIAGGYRSWRRRVSAALYDQPLAHRLVLLDGDTGSAKTAILAALAEHGAQTLDLEGLAEHRGSLLGALPGRPQPSQKLFESRLLERLETLDPARPVVVEAESSKVGERLIPPMLWRAMAAAPRIEIVAPRRARAAYVAQVYADAARNREGMASLLSRLPGGHGGKRLAAWRGLLDSGALAALAEALMEAHYDPAYARGRRADPRPRLATLALSDPATPGEVVNQIIELSK